MDEDLETAKFMLDRSYIMDADLLRVAAEIKRVRERNQRLDETGSLEDE
jgi:hypothetical protein